MKKITFDNFNYEQTPEDVREYVEKYNGICGEAVIASLFHITVKEVFEKWGIDMKNFKGFTTEKEMRIILNKFGYKCIRKRVKDKFSIPKCNFGILRVSYGNPKDHWQKIARESHYLGIVRYMQGRYVYDNAINLWDGKPINGVWIHESEYPKWMKAENMFITSYLELIKTEQFSRGEEKG
ncbi:MAG: hypothetical protein ACFFG0_19990 [Candidatus Thorarchaeota archaeon]